MTAKLDYDGGLTCSLPVSDLKHSIDWYQNVLGFKLLYTVDEMGWCELASPVERVNVGLSAVEKPNPGGSTPTFGVKDIEAAKAALKAKDVKLDGDVVTIEGMVKLLTFYDPSGNALMFYQDLSDAAG